MLYETIKADIKSAMLSKDNIKRDCLRMILSEVNNQNLLYKKDITDQLVLSVITKSVKSHKDSITMFEKSDRKDLLEKELAETKILEIYLPQMMNEDDTRTWIAKTIETEKIDIANRSAIGMLMKFAGKEKSLDKGLVSKLFKTEFSI